MKIRNVIFSLCLVGVLVFLFFVNVGLNISGPARYNEKVEEHVLEVVNKRFPLIGSLYRHNFEYVTYTSVSHGMAYVFDYEGGLVMQKEFIDGSFEEIQQRVFDEYGVEDATIHIGYGYDNMAYVVDEADFKVYFDYDTKDVIFYWRGNL